MFFALYFMHQAPNTKNHMDANSGADLYKVGFSVVLLMYRIEVN